MPPELARAAETRSGINQRNLRSSKTACEDAQGLPRARESRRILSPASHCKDFKRRSRKIADRIEDAKGARPMPKIYAITLLTFALIGCASHRDDSKAPPTSLGIQVKIVPTDQAELPPPRI